MPGQRKKSVRVAVVEPPVVSIPATAETLRSQGRSLHGSNSTLLLLQSSDERSEVSEPAAAEITCNACYQLDKGTITQFMTADKFLEKYPERVEGFNLYDYANEGYIDSEDLGSALSTVGYIVSPTDLHTVCQHLHIGRHSHVDFRLFTAVLAHQMMACSDVQIMEAFRIFDKEGRGTIDSKELKHIMTVLGVQTDEEQVDDMIREVDVDGDGDIDFQEFVAMIKK